MNAEIERINEGFAAIANAFQRARITVRASVPIKRETTLLESTTSRTTMPATVEWRLAWAKHNGAWCFLIERSLVGFDDNRGTISPLASANRQIRAEAAHVIPRLYEELVKEMRAQLGALKSAADALSLFTFELPDDIEPSNLPEDDGEDE